MLNRELLTSVQVSEAVAGEVSRTVLLVDEFRSDLVVEWILGKKNKEQGIKNNEIKVGRYCLTK